jgi:RimJ/RimL family protein N-acetyltransferase
VEVAPLETSRLLLEAVDPAEVRPEHEIPPVLIDRIRELPDRREWLVRFIRLRDSGELAGHCGFHGPPESIGRAEIGYTVFPSYRGRGFAKEAARALVDFAFAHGVDEVYASVRPDNAPSLAVVRALGFVPVGEQEDEEDGLELVFRLARRSQPEHPIAGVSGS